MADSNPLFTATAINHVALQVTDIARSRDFYVEHLGATVTSESDSACFLDVGGGDFLALFLRDEPVIEHFCFTVDDYEPDRTAERLAQAGLTVHRRDDRVFFKDPDGLIVQLSGPNRKMDDKPGGGGAET